MPNRYTNPTPAQQVRKELLALPRTSLERIARAYGRNPDLAQLSTPRALCDFVQSQPITNTHTSSRITVGMRAMSVSVGNAPNTDPQLFFVTRESHGTTESVQLGRLQPNLAATSLFQDGEAAQAFFQHCSKGLTLFRKEYPTTEAKRIREES